MRKNLPFVSVLVGTLFVANLVQGQSDRFAFAITDVNKEGANWSFLRKLNLETGIYSDVLLNGNDATLLAFDAETKKQFTAPLTDVRFGHVVNAAFGTGVAAIAFDRRNNRLYYTPMFIDQLRYIDLKTMKVYFVTGKDFTGMKTKAADQSNIVTRMAIAADGNGYALTNDGMHLIRFTTGKKLNVTDLGTLADNPENKINSVHNSCISYGGDMIADDDGNLFVFSARNHVFKINIETKVATHLGAVTGLPASFTINGAAVDNNNRILITSAVDATAVYTLDSETWTATPVKTIVPWRTADLANSNILQTRKRAVPDLIPGIVSLNNKIQLYPNPVTNNQVTIQFNQIAAGNYIIHLTDANGQQVAQKPVNINGKGQTTTTMNLSSSSARGIYIVKVIDNKRKTIYTNKVAVQ